MKNRMNRMVVLVLIGTLSSALALAKTTTKEVTFNQPVSVNGTLIKKGTYNLTFNDETSELTIKKGKKVLATVPARLEKTSDRYNSYTRADSTDPTKAAVLISVYLNDGNQLTIVDKTENTATSARP
jgi:hypothetical protein